MMQSYPGVIRSQGSYADGTDSLFIAFRRADAEGLPYREHARVPLTIRIGRRKYLAGLRTTPAQSIVYISSDLLDSSGEKVPLADALQENGFSRNERIILQEQRDEYLLRVNNS